MSIPRNPDMPPELLRNGVSSSPSDRPAERREPTRTTVSREKETFKERGGNRLWRNRWKIAAAGVGALILYHFRFWMREKLHLAFSKVPQAEIEGNMSTTAVMGRPNRALLGNGEARGTDSGSGVSSGGF